jgi:hypothetical protein
MRKLPAVEDARAIMTAGIDWSVWKWLLEQKRVREIADRATAALDRADQKAKDAWSDPLKRAYLELDAKPKRARRNSESKKEESESIDPEIRLTARRLKEADDAAERARLDAEDTFDEAERQMSASLAREGARKALITYDLREHAIRKSEAAARSA